jgi:hypothetical protein
MAATQRLTRALQQRLGDELSRELLTWMGRMDSSRSELTEFHTDFRNFVVQTNRRFDAIETRMSGIETRMSGIDTRMDAGFTRIEAKFDGKLEALEFKLGSMIDARHAELMKWAFVFWCGSIFAMVALVLATK